MTRYIALLRGVNVGGIVIRMNELARMVESLGHDDVRTVLASGNVLFTSTDTDSLRLKAGLEGALSDTFDYQAWVVLLTRDQLADAVQTYPFGPRPGWHSYVLFGSDPARLDELWQIAPTLDPDDERVSVGDGVLNWQVRRDVGVKSPFSLLTAKARYKSSTTNRNLNTLHKILDLDSPR